MIEEEIERRLGRIEQAVGLPKGITEPPTGKIRSSIVGPLAEIPEEEEKFNLDELLRRMAEMIENRFADLQGDVYEIIEEYISNENILNEARTFIRVTSPEIRKAYCDGAAGVATTIAGFLDVDTTGTAITIQCEIAGGGNLNAALPLLTDGLLISVWNDAGTWRCTTTFRKADICPLDV